MIIYVTPYFLSNKQNSILGLRGIKGFIDYVSTIADQAAPDPAIWVTTEVGGTVKVYSGTTDMSKCLINSGPAAGNYATISTMNLKCYCIKGDVKEIHLKTKFMHDDFTGRAFIGFAKTLVVDSVNNCIATVFNYQAGVIIDNDTLNYLSADGFAAEQTDASGHITSQSTYYVLEVVLDKDCARFYLNGILRATHTTRYPFYLLKAIIGTAYENVIASTLYWQYVEIWSE